MKMFCLICLNKTLQFVVSDHLVNEQISVKEKIMTHYTLVAIVEPKLFLHLGFRLCEKIHPYIWIA